MWTKYFIKVQVFNVKKMLYQYIKVAIFIKQISKK